MNPRVWMGLAAVFGFLAVALGAFGAHALRASLQPRSLEIYQTGVHYQMIHALALLAVGIIAALVPGVSTSALSFVGWAFTLGILIFSGSLYTLALTDVRWLGAITPLGGVAFLLGWATLAWACWSARS